MPRLFIDTSYYVAAILQRDQLHARALELAQLVRDSEFVTSEAVVLEIFDRLAEYGEGARRAAAGLLAELRGDPGAEIVPMTTVLLDRAVEFYSSRLDKGYSLTDCISMLVCRDRDIREVLTHDHHFEQEGLIALMR